VLNNFGEDVFHVKHQQLVTAYPAAEPNLEKFAHWLATEGLIRGLLGPREQGKIWDRHLANCAVISELIPQGATLIDIGSGAGLPGLVIAIVRPDVTCTLVEPLLRRSEFLQEVINDLKLPNVSVFRARADQVTHIQADVVTARAVAPLNKLLVWALPLMKSGGEILAMKGASANEEIAQAQNELKGFQAEVLTVGQGIVDPLTTVVRVHRVG